jgi:hypothetical protein
MQPAGLFASGLGEAVLLDNPRGTISTARIFQEGALRENARLISAIKDSNV